MCLFYVDFFFVCLRFRDQAAHMHPSPFDCCNTHTLCIALPVFLLTKGVSFVWVRLALLSVVTMETVLSLNEMMKWSVSKELPSPTPTRLTIHPSMCCGGKQERNKVDTGKMERQKKRKMRTKCGQHHEQKCQVRRRINKVRKRGENRRLGKCF